MKVVAGFLLGFGAALGLWPLLRPLLSAPLFERENLRGRRLPTAAGLVIVLATLALIFLWSMYDTIRDGPRPLLDQSLTTTALVVTGFGLFGLLDDLAGLGGPRGFGGHLAAVGRGELTTGMVKLVGGGLVAVVAAAPWAGDSFSQLVIGAVVVALAANLGNLLDRAPGRVEKVGLAAFVVLAASSLLATALTGPAIVLIALNVVSEFVSFSRVIERTPPLRWLDRLGAPPR